MKYKIGTRGSRLALAQAEYVRGKLAAAFSEDEFELHMIKTKGDRILDRPLHEIGDKGLFVKEIETKLLDGEIDIGVHSMKDMPANLPEGLILTRSWKRADCRDVLILREKKSLYDLPEGAIIGTGSKRRQCQLKRLRKDITTVNIRGNIDTRIKKMEEEKLDGIILAAAGLQRLGIKTHSMQLLSLEEMIPAPAQGILALEIRKNDEKLAHMLDLFADQDAMRAVEAERGFLKAIGGDCHIPTGAVFQKTPDASYQLRVMYGNAAGDRQAYALVNGNCPEDLAIRAAAAVRSQMAGMVYLTGSGPGDPRLISVRGITLIQEADCIIYDRLIPEQLLTEAKPGCQLIYVGKENHHHTMKQDQINRLLVQKSMEFEKTVRLKGGDPFVFGRGGEEGMFLKAHGVPFEIIPGISSCIAGPALAGIPVTHRGTALGFHVVTAHDSHDRLADIDFSALAAGKETCIFLMGLGMIKEIADRLMEAGMSGNTQIAIISRAATPWQKTCQSDLTHIAEEVKKADLVSPAVIVAGAVVSLREQLMSLPQRPLLQKRYLIPKVTGGYSKLGQLLRKQGAVVDEIQTGSITTINWHISASKIQEADWIIFTSKHGVMSFFENMSRCHYDLRTLARCKIAVIGEKTADCLKRYGLYADLIPETFHSGALALALKNVLTGREKVLYFRAKEAGEQLKQILETTCRLEEIPVYENSPLPLLLPAEKDLAEYDGILFTCASSVRRIMNARTDKGLFPATIYSIGPKTTACLHTYGERNVLEAAEATYSGLVTLCISGNGK